jgi:hypothetical protein
MSSTYDIQGRNCLFQILVDDVYQDVLCAKTFSFNRTYELKETTTVQSGFDKEFRPRKKSYTLSFNGVVQVEAAAGNSTIKSLFDYGEGFLPVNYRLIYEDNSSNVLVIQGAVYLSSAIFNANPINLLDGTIEMQGNGPIETLDTIPDLATLNIVCTGDNTIDAVVQFKLFNANGDVIFDSGQLPEASGGNLTHPFSVSAQIQKGSYSYWWQVTCDSIGNAFQLDAPPTASTPFNDNTTNDTTFGVQAYDFTATRTATFTLGTPAPPPACVAPSIPGSPTLHDGQVSVPWATSFPISGSAPFGITINNRPSWMSITIVDNGAGSYYVQFAGTPDATGTGILIDIDITNACGSVNFSDTIDVAAAPVTTSTIAWELDEIGGVGSLRIFRNAVLVVDATADSSGSFVANAGDTIEAQVLGVPFFTKFLEVRNVTDTTTLYSNTSNSSEIYSFVVVAAKTYSILGEIDS